jgi:hypothetical protein
VAVKKNNKVKKKFGVLIFVSAILLSACSTDFEVIGDWKETMVVYGLLDQSQPKQYIKINKAFLGKGNALEFAQVKDSVQFVNSLSVTLKKIKNGNEVASYTLTPDNSIPKDAGAFYGPDQGNAIYSFQSTGSNKLTDDSQYKLIIRNNETATEVTSQTELVKDFGPLSHPVSASAVASIIQKNFDDYPFEVSFVSAANARVYQVVIRLNYTDSTTSGNVAKTLDWQLSEKTTGSLDGNEEMNFTFVGQDYMKFIGNSLSDYTGLVKRTSGDLEIIVISAADELNTFINVNKPSTGIIQEKPEYTNITNGLGIFSARFYKTPFKRPLSAVTIDTLSGGRYTHCLKFVSGDEWLGAGLPCN